jgi:hypothetical protein
MRFLFSWGKKTVLGSRGFLEEKKMKATPPFEYWWPRLLLLAPRVLAVFAEENSWSRSLKKEQKNECVVVSSFV